MHDVTTVAGFADAAARLIASARAESVITRKTASTLARGLRDLAGWAQLTGATSRDDLEDLAAAWVTSAVLSHRGIQKPPAVDTLHRRRFVVAWIWREARRAGLTETDPCRDLELPSRTTGERAPLTDQQVAALDVAASTWQSTRKRRLRRCGVWGSQRVDPGPATRADRPAPTTDDPGRPDPLGGTPPRRVPG